MSMAGWSSVVDTHKAGQDAQPFLRRCLRTGRKVSLLQTAGAKLIVFLQQGTAVAILSPFVNSRLEALEFTHSLKQRIACLLC